MNLASMNTLKKSTTSTWIHYRGGVPAAPVFQSWLSMPENTCVYRQLVLHQRESLALQFFFIVTARRNSLTSENVDMLTFLAKNL